MIANLEATLAKTGQASNTDIVFSSDNWYHMADYRLNPGKMTAFDSDVHVPLVAAGPGIKAGNVASPPLQNIDLRPTFEAFAGAPTPADVDGHSLTPLLLRAGAVKAAGPTPAGVPRRWSNTTAPTSTKRTRTTPVETAATPPLTRPCAPPPTPTSNTPTAPRSTTTARPTRTSCTTPRRPCHPAPAQHCTPTWLPSPTATAKPPAGAPATPLTRPAAPSDSQAHRPRHPDRPAHPRRRRPLAGLNMPDQRHRPDPALLGGRDKMLAAAAGSSSARTSPASSRPSTRRSRRPVPLSSSGSGRAVPTARPARTASWPQRSVGPASPGRSAW